YGWRDACLIWATINLCLALPLNWLLIPPAPPLPPPTASQRATPEAAPPRGAMPILAFYFAATAFVTGAMAAHLPRFLESIGASTTAAIAAGALVGPAQVAARLVEFGLLRTIHPVWSARIAALMHPLAAVATGALGPAGISLFAVVHGAGNGMITIAKGTLPLAVFGPDGYGLRNGILSVPARVALAAAPFLFGLLLDDVGAAAILLSAGLSLAAFASLLLLRRRSAAAIAAAD
ncbi:MAG TPA: MFS transporter, partial [Stellaceae bacterium]|nr:MFS transporter [Stellaceae bacterium]